MWESLAFKRVPSPGGFFEADIFRFLNQDKID